MKYLFVGTTAINRTELHNDNIKEWANFLRKKHSLKIIWIINIDLVDVLKDSWIETKENFLNEINIENCDIIILPKKEPGFLNACQVVSSKIINYIDENEINKNDVFVFWLEDDWKLNKVSSSNISLNFFFNICNQRSFVNFTFIKNNYFWALAPSLMSYDYFYKIHYSCWKELKINNVNGDPEHLLGLYFRNKISDKYFGDDINKPNNMLSINIINNQFKKIKTSFLDNNFMKREKTFSIIYDKQYCPDFELPNQIEIENLKNIISNKYCYFRLTPALTDGGVEYGRSFMKNKKVKKWDRGNSVCNYQKV